MQVNSTNPAYTGANFADTGTTTPTTTTGTQTLGADDFLKLLTTQLSNQDPMKPMEDTQFIAQMAQFTSLEQMRGLATNFSSFTKDQRLISAQQYLGKTVTINGPDGIVTGAVTDVSMVDDAPQIVVGGTTYDPAEVTNIRQVATQP